MAIAQPLNSIIMIGTRNPLHDDFYSRVYEQLYNKEIFLGNLVTTFNKQEIDLCAKPLVKKACPFLEQNFFHPILNSKGYQIFL
jgi:hypothetical protein